MSAITKKIAATFSSTIDGILKLILVLSSITLTLTMCVTVVLRYIFQMDIFGLEELIMVPGFWLYYLGAGYATKEKDFHIQADLISSFVDSQYIINIIKLITSFITVIVSIIMAYWTIEFLWDSITLSTKTPALKIPVWISRSSIFIGFSIMSIYFLKHFIKDIYVFIRPKGEE